MARIDKYDPVSGGFRAPLEADFAASEDPIGVGLNSAGRVVPGAGNTGIVGVISLPYGKKAGDIIDVMTDGELVEFTGIAGTVMTANTTTGAIDATAVSASQIQVGFTVVANDRLIVRVAR